MNISDDNLKLIPFEKESEENYIRRIKERVEQLISEDINLLFSYLYRLDVEEWKIQELIKNTPSDLFSEKLASEIWNRQKIRLQHKKDIIVPKIKEEGWDL